MAKIRYLINWLNWKKKHLVGNYLLPVASLCYNVFDFLVEILKFLYEKNWTRKKIGWLVSWMLNFLIWNWIQHKIFRHVKTVERSILLFFLLQKMIKRGQNCHENFVTFRRKWYVQIVSWFADLLFILTSTEEQNSTYLFF